MRLNAALGLYAAVIDAPLLAVDPRFVPTPNAFLWGVATALMAQVGGFMLWFLGVRELGPVTASSLSILVPVFAFIFVYLMLGKAPTAMELAGSAMTLAGVLPSQLARPSNAAAGLNRRKPLEVRQ